MYSVIDTDRIVNLKVVAKLKKGDKLNTRLQHYGIEPPGIFSTASIMRWINGESRRQTINALDTLITSCIKQANLSDNEIATLVEQLYHTSTGIENLIFTYKDDVTSVSGLELIIQKIRYFISLNGGFTPHVDQITHSSNMGEALDMIEEEVEDEADDE